MILQYPQWIQLLIYPKVCFGFVLFFTLAVSIFMSKVEWFVRIIHSISSLSVEKKYAMYWTYWSVVTPWQNCVFKTNFSEVNVILPLRGISVTKIYSFGGVYKTIQSSSCWHGDPVFIFSHKVKKKSKKIKPWSNASLPNEPWLGHATYIGATANAFRRRSYREHKSSSKHKRTESMRIPLVSRRGKRSKPCHLTQYHLPMNRTSLES